MIELGELLLQTCSFEDTLAKHEVSQTRKSIDTLQLNITKKCNQRCRHCHVNAGPDIKEEMPALIINRIIDLLANNQNIKTVDLTGGAPELNPNFKYLVRRLKELELEIVDRCNLTILLEAGQEDTANILAENGVTVCASLPCYTQDNVDLQRGTDVYTKSIEALVKLNALGYGKEGSGLKLHLVYNPLDDYLPGDQTKLQADYKEALEDRYGIVFNNLYTISNMPIGRYEHMLTHDKKLSRYNSLLCAAFNHEAADKVMCKSQISVDYDGRLFDCDFNIALNKPICSNENSVWKINDFAEITDRIAFGQHCFACVAGSGSSCKGTLV